MKKIKTKYEEQNLLSQIMFCEVNGEWKVCHPNTLINGEGKNKKIIWG